MHFRAAASVAILACATHVAAEAKPYKLAVMPLPGLSLARRDTSGYQPDETKCSDGDTCAEACGTDFTQCPSDDDMTHCFNPAASQSCCHDGSGNSCEDGYYCTHDTSMETWCCPDALDIAACAAAYSVTGGLETPVLTTSTPTPTSTSVSTTSTPSSTSTSTTSTTSTTPSSTPVVTKTKDVTTSVCATSSGYSTAWTGSNSTITSLVPTQPIETIPAVVPTTTGGSSPPPPITTGGASANAISGLLLLAAGAVAFL